MRLSLSVVVPLVLFSVVAQATFLRDRPEERTDPPEYRRGESRLVSTGTLDALLQRESAGPDTFDLYGGPRNLLRDPDGVPGSGDEYVEGKFEDALGFSPSGLSSSPGDWTAVDRSERDSGSGISTFGADLLGNAGPGNHAWWIGLEADDPRAATWESAPGYGNGWNETFHFESPPVSDPNAGQTVGLGFVFNYDTEPMYDYVYVEYQKGDSWVEVFSADGATSGISGQIVAPGEQFAGHVDALPIVYDGADYPDDRIRIRIRFSSDYVYSDEDGLFDTMGAIQFDDVEVTAIDGTWTEDFEGELDASVFRRGESPFAGDFASLFDLMTDIDPCAENQSAKVGFIDFGQAPPNGPGLDGTVSTGGSISDDWNYGISGGYVVNYTGGIGDPVLSPIHNEVWSPPFDWDLPGSADDAAEFVGSALSFSVWEHLPLINGMFFVWHVRYEESGVWSPWMNEFLVYYGSDPVWTRRHFDTSELIPASADRVQIALGVRDLSIEFSFPGDDATPAPFFDDVRLVKYRIDGPVLSAEKSWLPQDAFPASGTFDVATVAGRGAMDVRVDMGRDIARNSSEAIVSGDSLVVIAETVIEGAPLVDLRLVWSLRQNPVFEAALRLDPSAAGFDDFQETVDGSVTTWSGSVAADPVTLEGGGVEGRFFADLPDENFMYPGDVLHFYWQAEDGEGRVSTLPADVSGYGVFDAEGRTEYDRRWTMRALPSVAQSADRLKVLVVDDAETDAEIETFLAATSRRDLIEGVDFDVYRVRDPEREDSNGIGAAAGPTPLGDRRGPGATVAQIAGYEGILVLAGGQFRGVLSDGSNDYWSDKGDDLGLLESFADLPGPRFVALVGDRVAESLNASTSSGGVSYLTNRLGVEFRSTDVSGRFQGTKNLMVSPLLFGLGWTVIGGCPEYALLDEIGPIGAAVSGWVYVDPQTQSPSSVSAGVVHETLGAITLNRVIHALLPYRLSLVGGGTGGYPGADRLFDALFDHLTGIWVGPPLDAPVDVRDPSVDLYPNPFNPSTKIDFVLPQAGVEARVVIYDVRGQRVRVLHDGVAEVADLVLTWDGTDDRGRGVGSGVYLVRAETTGFRQTKKAVLVK